MPFDFCLPLMLDQPKTPTRRHRLWLVVPAAGVGQRAGAGLPKQYRLIQGEPMLLRTIRALQAVPGLIQTASTSLSCPPADHPGKPDALICAGLLVVLSPQDAHWDLAGLAEACAPMSLPVQVQRIGGDSRRDTVLAALDALQALGNGDAAQDWVMVHDAARPHLSPAALGRLLQLLLQEPHGPGGLLALPVADTLQRANWVNGQPCVDETVPRDGLWSAQTPQVFRLGPLREALMACPLATDEASAMRQMGHHPRLVVGDPMNRKFTFPEDFA